MRLAVEHALRSGGWTEAASVDVLLRDEDEMRQINTNSRGVQEPTDVLSFPLFEMQPGRGSTLDAFVLPPGTTPHLGDVVVCIDRAKDQAGAYGHSFERELAYLTVHGVLHLLGYDHERPAERRAMRQREEAALADLGLTRVA